jgi:hypothetical protein
MSRYNKELQFKNAYLKINRQFRRDRSLQKKWREAFSIADNKFRLNNPVFSFYYFEHRKEVVSIATNKLNGHTYFNYTNLLKATRRRIYLDKSNYLLDTSKSLIQAFKRGKNTPTPLFVDLYHMHHDLLACQEFKFHIYHTAITQMKLPSVGFQIHVRDEVYWERCGLNQEKLIVGYDIKPEENNLYIAANARYYVNNKKIAFTFSNIF